MGSGLFGMCDGGNEVKWWEVGCLECAMGEMR